jgi:catechol O-methyltransferase
MEAEEGRRWRTKTHRTHAEYQSLVRDLVLESTLLRA